MEDLYVTPSYRKRRVGLALMNAVAKIAVDELCARIDFSVLEWNKEAAKFYKQLNAVDLTELEDWHYYRISEDNVKKIAACDIFNNMQDV